MVYGDVEEEWVSPDWCSAAAGVEELWIGGSDAAVAMRLLALGLTNIRECVFPPGLMLQRWVGEIPGDEGGA